MPSVLLLASIFFLIYSDQNISERIYFVKSKRKSTQSFLFLVDMVVGACAGYLGHPFRESGLLCMMEQAFLLK